MESWGVVAESRRTVATMRTQLMGRDLALIAAGLTFYSGVAIVPLLLLSMALTALVSSAEQVRSLGADLARALPPELGAPQVVERLVDAGVGLGLLGGVIALFPMSFYGEGLRRALLRFRGGDETLTGWRGRLLALPPLLLTPVLLYPLLLVGRTLAGLGDDGGAGSTVGAVALGFYAVLAALVLPLAWTFRVVAAGQLGWRGVLVGSVVTAACLSGFLQGFVLFLALPLDLGAPFGGLTVVGAVAAVGLWLFLLHVVLLVGWVFALALERRRGG